MCFDCWHEIQALTDHGIWCVPSAPNPFTHEQPWSHYAGAAVSDRGCRSQRLRLQIAALQKNRTGARASLQEATTATSQDVSQMSGDEAKIETARAQFPV